MKVFIQMENTSIDYKLTKGQNGFDIEVIGDAPTTLAFDYRVVAKRKGFEDQRLPLKLGSYTDHYLYPTIEDVPQEWRLDWVKNCVIDEWDVKWFDHLTPEQSKHAMELYQQYKDGQQSENNKPAPEPISKDNLAK